MGISRFTLSRLFAEKMECSFLDYLNRLRVECSLELLQDGHLTVNQAGEACGFQSESRFFSPFSALHGDDASSVPEGRAEGSDGNCACFN